MNRVTLMRRNEIGGGIELSQKTEKKQRKRGIKCVEETGGSEQSAGFRPEWW